jgi:acyl-CoA thioesterase I
LSVGRINDAPCMQRDAPLAAPGDLRVVGNDNQRGAAIAVQFEHQVDDGLAGTRVQASGGLVGEQYSRPDHERAGQRHALLLTTGQRARRMRQPPAQADAFQELARQLLGLRTPGPPLRRDLQRESDVLERSQVRQQLERLEHETDTLGAQARPGVLVHATEFLAEQADRTRTGDVEAGQNTQQGRLAGSGRPGDRERAPGRHRQVDVIEDRQAAIGVRHDLAQSGCLDGIGQLLTRLLLHLRLFALCMTVAAFPAAAATGSAPAHVILVVGDSLSSEYGLPRDTGWVHRLSERIGSTHDEYSVVNASISGDTTQGGLSRLPRLLAQTRPSHVILELGANDGLRGLDLEQMRATLQSMIDQCRRGGARVVLVGIRVPPNYGRDYADRFAQTYGRLAQSNRLAYVPFLLEGFADQLDLFQADRIHPTEQAQERMLANVWLVLEPQLKHRGS